MTKPRAPRQHYPPLDLGPLPIDAIGPALGLQLRPGAVHLSARAHQHMAEKHPDDYAICLAALPAAIAAPSLVGQGPGQDRNFEIIKRVTASNDRAVLVAVGVEVGQAGRYRIRSSYLISSAAVERRRSAGRLRSVRPDR